MFTLMPFPFLLDILAGYGAWRISTPALLALGLLGHALACWLYAVAAVRSLAETMDEVRTRDQFFFMSLSFFLPIIGMLGLCHALGAFKRSRIQGNEGNAGMQTVAAMTLPTVLRAAGARPAAVNTGMLISVLQNAREPSQRTSAILATLRLPDQDAINILRVALKDSEDDIRLLAYALLSQMDKRYNEGIQNHLALLRKSTGNRACFLHKQIAQEYWELAWVGLARGESVGAILDKALEHVTQALDGYPNDGGLHFLLGKTLLRMRRFKEAAGALASAERYGIPSGRLASYREEAHMARRRSTTSTPSTQLAAVAASTATWEGATP